MHTTTRLCSIRRPGAARPAGCGMMPVERRGVPRQRHRAQLLPTGIDPWRCYSDSRDSSWTQAAGSSAAGLPELR